MVCVDQYILLSMFFIFLKNIFMRSFFFLYILIQRICNHLFIYNKFIFILLYHVKVIVGNLLYLKVNFRFVYPSSKWMQILLKKNMSHLRFYQSCHIYSSLFPDYWGVLEIFIIKFIKMVV